MTGVRGLDRSSTSCTSRAVTPAAWPFSVRFDLVIRWSLPARLHSDRRFDTARGERQLAQAHAGGARHRIGHRGGGRTLTGLAGAEEFLARAIDHVHLDALRQSGEADRREARPVAAQDGLAVEAHRLVQRPARRLHNGAFGLIADAVRVDGLAGVDGGDDAAELDRAGLVLDFGLAREGAIGGEVLVARKGEAATAPAR